MAWADTTRKVENSAAPVGSLAMTLTGTAAGSLIVVGTSVFKTDSTAIASIGVSDPTNGAYSQAILKYFGASPAQVACAIHYVVNTGTGDRVITVDPVLTTGTDQFDMWIAAHEFSGSSSSPLSGTPVGTNGTSAVCSTSAMTPPDNDVLLIGVCLVDGTTTITENQAGEGFTLSNESESGGAGGEPGSLVFKIISGAPGSVSHTWALGATVSWIGAIAAFKPLSAWLLTAGDMITAGDIRFVPAP